MTDGALQALPEELRAAVRRALAGSGAPVRRGTVRSVAAGPVLEVEGLSGAVGDLCRIETFGGGVPAELVGFRDARSVVMPFGPLEGVAPGAVVESRGRPLEVPVGSGLLGRVIDPLGRPLDGGPPVRGRRVAVRRSPASDPLARRPVGEVFETGIAAIDGLCTVGKGQRLVLRAAAGAGGSQLFGRLARSAGADVQVFVLPGGQGCEAARLVDEVLGPVVLARSVVVVATADMAPLLRLGAVSTAATVAEELRDAGRDVLFACDPVAGFLAAAREVGLAVGEPAAAEAALVRLVERLGNTARGSITALLRLDAAAEGALDPVTALLRGHVDGEIVLAGGHAVDDRGPVVDILASVSRLMPRLTTPRHRAAAETLRRLLARDDHPPALASRCRAGMPTRPEEIGALGPEVEELLGPAAAPRPFEATVAALQRAAEASTWEGVPVDE